MSAEECDTKVTVRDLQRNAAAVLQRIEHGETITVTRRGKTVARIVPPDPAEDAINRAIADGYLDPADLARARTAAESARRHPAPTAPDEKPATQVLAELREEDSER
ncbi:type II toxin-antitoxin system Phd/YefM family antitoxin [Streptomyces sp. 6N223]|uniref:type II toxin-antitoxin system Phd/YefM family antitoxin n=1 Tax=Streptomyces sp. 6N223 TaxID=3457412 RepID=UPI003FD4973D